MTENKRLVKIKYNMASGESFSEDFLPLEIFAKRCNAILSKDSLNEEEIVEALISLHLILEMTLNIFFRYIALMRMNMEIDKLETIANIDRINFIDKTVTYIYNSSFDFGADLKEATKHHSIIASLKDFSKIRNLLLHGHGIVIMENKEGKTKISDAKKVAVKKTLIKQIETFKAVIDGMRFYSEHTRQVNFVPKEQPSDKNTLAKMLLNYNFLPGKYI